MRIRNQRLFIIISFMLIVGLVMTALSPWLSDEMVIEIAVNRFNKINADVQDGCGLNCKDCGVKGVDEVLFGKVVTIEFNCGGPIPEDQNNKMKNYTTTVRVLFFGFAIVKGFE